MKKVVFGSALFIGGIMFLYLLVFTGASGGNFFDLILYILDFALICAGFILGLIGIKKDRT